MSSDDTRSFSSSFELDSGNFSGDMSAERSPFAFDLPPPHKVADIPKRIVLWLNEEKHWLSRLSKQLLSAIVSYKKEPAS